MLDYMNQVAYLVALIGLGLLVKAKVQGVYQAARVKKDDEDTSVVLRVRKRENLDRPSGPLGKWTPWPERAVRNAERAKHARFVRGEPYEIQRLDVNSDDQKSSVHPAHGYTYGHGDARGGSDV